MQFDYVTEIIKAKQCRLPALPDELPVVLADKGGKDRVGHPEIFALGKEFFFFQIEAVGAVQVAARADRLGDNVEVRTIGH